jgi:undecaprenyl-diphosphatase
LISFIIRLDQDITLGLNSLVGKSPVLDFLLRGLANDYFVPVIFALAAFGLWVFGSVRQGGARYQMTALCAATSLGLANGMVKICNHFFFRTRPFNEIAINILVNKPSDPSLPSNAAATLFAVAFAVRFSHRRLGNVMLAAAAVEGLSRVVAGMHYPTDIIAGAAAGLAAAVLAGWLLKILKVIPSAIITSYGWLLDWSGSGHSSSRSLEAD